MLTASRDQQEIVESLLRRGANPNLCSDMGYTPFMRAAGHGAIDIIKMLFATIERLGEHPIPELGGVCWIAILLIAELEKEFHTSRWAKSLLAHPAYLATLSERLSEIGNIAAALSVADQVENREARDLSLGEVIKAQIQNVQFEAAINTAQRITLESFCSALIDILRAARLAGLDLRNLIRNVNLDRGCTSWNRALLYAELGRSNDALNLVAKIEARTIGNCDLQYSARGVQTTNSARFGIREPGSDEVRQVDEDPQHCSSKKLVQKLLLRKAI